MKTLAEFKREAKKGNMYLEMIGNDNYRNELPDRLKGKRPVTEVHSNHIIVKTADGKKSYLEMNRASLVEYDGNTLTIYYPLVRSLTEEEKKVYNRGEEIRKEWHTKHGTSPEMYIMSDMCDYGAINARDKYYEEKGMGYLSLFLASHNKPVNGKYPCGSDKDGLKIMDFKSKGNISLKYNVYFE